MSGLNYRVHYKEAILGHMYYATPSLDNESIVLHDADILDFLGVIGIVRIFSVTERHTWAEDLSGALMTLNRFRNDLQTLLITESAKKIAKKRILEMDQFFLLLNSETFNKKAL